jgi:hypothetical protein
MSKIHEVQRQGKFRSKLEKYCSDMLKKNKIKFEYEKERIVLIPKFRYEGISLEKIGKSRELKQQRQGQAACTYLPDFVGEGWVIECKGFFTPQARLKWKLYKKYLLDNNIKVDLYMPSNQRQVRRVMKEILKKNKKNKKK